MGFFDFLKRKRNRKKQPPPPSNTAAPTKPPTQEDPTSQTQPSPVSPTLEKAPPKKKPSFFSRLKSIFLGTPKLDQDLLDAIEEVLITTDMGFETADQLIQKLKKHPQKLDFPQAIALLKEEISQQLQTPLPTPESTTHISTKPHIILVIGVNGAGKTTTIGKLAHWYQQQGKKVMIGAADTFRAAAVEQITAWGQRLQLPVISLGMHKDPGSVAFEAVEQAIAQDIDVLLIDTAGRLHNKVGLMNELAKVKRVIGKKRAHTPQETLLVVDGSTGQNAWQQAKLFHEKLAITGLVVTKLDGVAKGGVLIGLSTQLHIPIKYVGIGEKINDLAPFDTHDFVEQLFAQEDTHITNPVG